MPFICLLFIITVTEYVPSVLSACEINVFVKLFPLCFISFLLLTLHPASHKGLAVGFDTQ